MLIHVFWYLLYADDVLITLSATPLQTFPLAVKVVLVAQTASESEEFTAHRRGVVEIMLGKPKAGPNVWSRCTGLCEGERGSLSQLHQELKMPSGVHARRTYLFR